MSALYATINSDTRKTQATSRGSKHIRSNTRTRETQIVVEINIVDGKIFAVVFKRHASGTNTVFFNGEIA